MVLGAAAEEEGEEVGGRHEGATVGVAVAAAGYDDTGTVAERDVQDRDQEVEKEDHAPMKETAGAGDETQTAAVVAYWLLAAVAEHMP